MAKSKFEKSINKTSGIVAKNVATFTTMIEEADKAIYSYDCTVKELCDEIAYLTELKEAAKIEKESAEKLKENLSQLISK